jgi:hypothetical protein
MREQSRRHRQGSPRSGLVGTGATKSCCRTPIISAVQNNSQGVIKLLIERGARYNTQDLWQTAVTTANASPLRLTQFLIDEGFPITIDVVQTITSRTCSYDSLTEDQKMVIILVCDKISRAYHFHGLKARQILYLREALESILEECEDRRKELTAKQLRFEKVAKEALVWFQGANH